MHLMAEGLEKMLAKKTMERTVVAAHSIAASPAPQPVAPMANGDVLFGENFEDAFNFGTSSFLNFDTGTLDLDFNGFGF